MHAILTDPHGGLRWGELPDPQPGPGELRLRVAATAVNRADLLQRKGLYPPPPGASPVLGLECAGWVEATGPGVTRWREGDAVCALLAGGGHAQRVVCDASLCLPVPEGLDLVQAAALPEVWATAWLNLFIEGALQPGETALVLAGASGVGTAAVQLLRLTGNPCWVSVGSQRKLDVCVSLGARGGVIRHDLSFAERAMDWTGGRGLDLILDPVGAASLADGQRSLAPGGRIVLIGIMGGARATLDLGRLLVKRQRIIGSTLRARPVAEKAALLRALEARVWPALARGELRPVIEDVLPIEQIEAAHARLAADDTIGKLVLRVP